MSEIQSHGHTGNSLISGVVAAGPKQGCRDKRGNFKSTTLVQSRRRYRATRSFFTHAFVWLIAFGLVAAISPPARSQDRPVRITVFGDSLTAGYGLLPEQAFPARLQAWLIAHGVSAEIINAGESGDTSADGLARLDWSLNDRPDWVFVEFGANDALRGIDPDVTLQNLDQILSRLQANKVKAFLLGMRAPSNWGAEYQRRFDATFPELAKRYNVPLYPFFLEGVALQQDLNQADGIHPNERGVDVIVDRLGPIVLRLMDESNTASPQSSTR